MYMRKSLIYANRLNLVKFCNKNTQQGVIRLASGYRFDYDESKKTTGSKYVKYLTLIGSGSLISYFLAHKFANDDSTTVFADSQKKNIKNAHSIIREDLPGYTKSDVAQHDSNETGIWVSYGSGVYDITSFVPKHPGKTKIIFAAGKSIDAVWEHAKIHKTPHILHYFETFRIGNLIDENEVKPVEISSIHNTVRTDLPTYHADEVANHNSNETGIWVTYGIGVYDITNFIPQHPGSSKIMMAAGSAIDPFWHIFQQHNTNEILSLLETFRIGNLSKEDVVSTTDLYDPWSTEPKRHPILKAESLKPYNAETPVSLLVESFITPNDFFYIRNHLPVPEIDVTSYELEVTIENSEKSIALSLDQLRTKYPKCSVTATIMCGGNRRSEMEEIRHIKGLSWEQGAVGNATWSGARLCDILADMGVQMDETSHVQFEGLDMDPTSTPYGASIPLTKALDPRGDVILAYEMNGKPLSRDHGYPLRVVVPGVVGARNVKWLGKITVSPNESEAHWQQNDYKAFSPNVDWDIVDFKTSPAIQNMPVTSAICSPMNGDEVEIKDGFISIKGYAWSGGGNDINRVDITIDGGEKWHVAELEKENKEVGQGRHWSWSLWTAKIPMSQSGQIEIWAKAVDSNNNVQPENFKNIWNLRGVAGNAYHKVKVHVK